MLILQGITYAHPDRDVLFEDIDLTINRQDKVALIGNNGSGKSTLLRIMAGELIATSGNIRTVTKPYYVPQILGQFNELSVAAALGIANKIAALKQILAGDVTDEALTILNDDWNIEERCADALAHWQLNGINITQKIGTLSGGQKTKVFLAGITINEPELVLLDEPSNHLDKCCRDILYEHIKSTTNTLVVVSHDRTLLNLIDDVAELGRYGITRYGGNYAFYTAQKKIENDALNDDVKAKEKALRKARETEREALERAQKLDARGKKEQDKAGMPTIMMNTMRNGAEKSTARLKDIHDAKTGALAEDLDKLRKELPGTDKMRMNLDHSGLHKGKVLITVKDVNISYSGREMWKRDLSVELRSGERVAISGANGSGKTTLMKLILGELLPQRGTVVRAEARAIYIDQEYSIVNNDKTVYEQVQQYNTESLLEHEVKIKLARFLFTKNHWNKRCRDLSGGEKMRLIVCCMTMSTTPPDIIALDEPTNNLDIQNIEILTTALNDYKGTLIAVSHDAYFLREINVERIISLE